MLRRKWGIVRYGSNFASRSTNPQSRQKGTASLTDRTVLCYGGALHQDGP
jgi:hypothetical protein